VVFVIGSQPSVWTWLAPVLAFVSSLILFGGSMFGVWWTNRTADRRASEGRQNERERDLRLWQRDTLLRLGYEALQAGIEARQEYYKYFMSRDALTQESRDTIDTCAQKVMTTIERLRLIGAHETADYCRGMLLAITDKRLPRVILQRAEFTQSLVTAKRDAKSDETVAGEEHLRRQVVELIDRIATTRLAFGQSVERELTNTNRPEPVSRRRAPEDPPAGQPGPQDNPPG
jgi:hypothetical protein